MKKPGASKFKDVVRMFKAFGIETARGKKHWLFLAADGRKYPFPAKSRTADVDRCYIDAARRRFNLTPADGVSDEKFYSA